jgi:diacylglycerol O-acyltransferase / wax synthase
MVAIAPINARPADGRATTEGNNITAMTLKLSTGIADPVERLRAIRSYTAEAKEARAGLSARIMTDLSKHIPGATLAGIARMVSNPHLALRQANVLVSNVPGPQKELFMNGARLTHYYAMGPLANNLGLFLSIVSYNGQMNFSITSERVMLPDISVMKDKLVDEFNALKSCLGVGA